MLESSNTSANISSYEGVVDIIDLNNHTQPLQTNWVDAMMKDESDTPIIQIITNDDVSGAPITRTFNMQ